MDRRLPRQRPGARLRAGQRLLIRCHLADTSLITARLQHFTAAHDDYAAAQKAVLAARRDVVEQRARLASLDAARNDAIDALARALALDGQPRMRPLSAYCKTSPSLLKRMAANRKAQTLRLLVLAVHRDTSLSPLCIQAAAALARSGDLVAEARHALDRSEAVLQHEILRRDAIGAIWDKALGALKRRVLCAVDDGAAGLHRFLFPVERRRRRSVRSARVEVRPDPLRQVSAENGIVAAAAIPGDRAPAVAPLDRRLTAATRRGCYSWPTSAAPVVNASADGLKIGIPGATLGP